MFSNDIHIYIGNKTLMAFHKGQYFNNTYEKSKKDLEDSSSSTGLKGWPPVFKAIHAGMEDKSSELVLCAIGNEMSLYTTVKYECVDFRLSQVFPLVLPLT